ncbi:DUF4145 domain-containing protein [Pseudoalteromonas piscicida]|uniref:DUF4145 domain-containing protein n=1 Tax=Pseudoalteromonas piscicida TaxID=43662 RepID=UPI001C98DCBF|nr:DUF4145 domain-containing protein [Pseudoalteromonas piscicida]QZO14570.1 DUF4145 domain-containing protein [Pseudoalteromonas piscicida]
MVGNPEEILICYHCGNRVPLRRKEIHRGQELYENIEGKRYYEDFDYLIYQCPTCQGISIYGNFTAFPKNENTNSKRIYPLGGHLIPENHKVFSSDCIPHQVVKTYEEIWPLRHIAPNAFAGQVRRALEYICKDQNAEGKTLFKQLENLVSKGIFPGYFAEITDLMRQIGNLGSHASDNEVDFWDAELLDDFFRSVIEYVYIAPSKIKRLKQRMGERSS